MTTIDSRNPVDSHGRAFLTVALVAIAAAAALVLADFGSPRAGAASYVVTNNADSGAGSLRQAITDSNASVGVVDTITFAAGYNIAPASALPTISDAVIIDGTSGGLPGVSLDGSSAVGVFDGLLISAGSSTIRGLSIGNFPGYGIQMTTAGNNVVENNYIGLATDGTTARPNGDSGIRIYINSNNRIGGPLASQRNVISKNGGLAGIVIEDGFDNTIQGNYIGTNAAGTAAKANGDGIFLTSGSKRTLIGGASPGMGNVISGNTAQGIEIACCGDNTVQGNLIGVDKTGSFAVANGRGIGAYSLPASAGNLIGGSSPGARNVISGNLSDGIRLYLSLGFNTVTGNYIGVGSDGATAIGNTGPGVHMNWSSNNAIGGPNGQQNIIAYNGDGGVKNDGSAGLTEKNPIRQNSIYANTTAGIININGGNNGLAKPTITSTAPPTGTACASCTVDVFTDAGSQGRYFEDTVMADGAGNWSYYGPLTGANVTATATDASTNTSEFSTAAAFAPCSGTYCLTGFWTLDLVGTLTNFCSIAETQSGTSTVWGTFSCTTPAFGTFTGTIDQSTRALSSIGVITASGATFSFTGTLAVNGLSAAGTWTCTLICTGNSGTWTANRPNAGGSNTLTLSPTVPQTYAGVTVTTPAGAPPITATFEPTSAPFVNGHPLRTEIHFEPSGLDLSSFNPPYVTVSANYAATPNDLPPAPDDDPCKLAFYSLDETTNTWQYQSNVTACNAALKTFSYRVSHFSFRSGAAGVDSDQDGPPDNLDNCWDVSNSDQAISDWEFTDLHAFGLLVDDWTNPNSDQDGNACERDGDYDNDGLLNQVETSFVFHDSRCPLTSGPTDINKSDTDGDRVLDGAECALGTNPNDPNSKPPAMPSGDTDHDGLTDAFEQTIGTNPLVVDTDGDKINDGVEYEFYNTNPLARYTDRDLHGDDATPCDDGKEIASVTDSAPPWWPVGPWEAVHKVNSADQLTVAKRFNALAGQPNYILDLDINRDGKINSGDLLIQAKANGSCQ